MTVQQPTGEKAVILVIDDEPSIADALKLILEDKGYDVLVSLSGRRGVEQTCASRIDLTITDLQLPDFSGFDVLTAIREREPESLVILITAYGSDEIKAEAASRGAFSVLSKPFYPAEVLNQVAAALATRKTGDS
jgi:two-component system phosphate regulon sensor histidine kinase PhoR